MAGTLTVGQLAPDVGTNLYINAQQYGGNVIVGNTTTTLLNISPSGNTTVNGVITSNTITSNTGASLVLQSNNTTAITVDTSQNATFAGSINSPNTFGFKNRIINGGMVIDQRNAGASVTATSNPFTLDRWRAITSQSAKFTVQQTPSATETGYATRVGAGFTNYLACTSSSAYSITSTDYFLLRQIIEGYNASDFAWGTSSAKTVTLSFWAYSSLTGTFGGSLQNDNQDTTYIFSYSIPTANTWTQISVTITGSTSGTWLKTNGAGIYVSFGLGVGSTLSGTAGSWLSGNYFSATGATSVVGTNGATFYITGVQLEKGSVATTFDYRPYGTELALCQRYYEICTFSCIWSGYATSGNNFFSNNFYKVSKRANATTTTTNQGVLNFPTTAPSVNTSTLEGFDAFKAPSATGNGYFQYTWTASAEL